MKKIFIGSGLIAMMLLTSNCLAGDEMRELTKKEKVTPKGTPASIKPKNKGTALHEQNGVTMPKSAANILPMYFFSWLRIALVLSGEKNVLIKDTIKMMTVSNRNIFTVSYKKKFKASEKSAPFGILKRS